MTPKEARQFIPYKTGYYYNTWYPGEHNGNKFDVSVNKQQFLSVRKPCIFNIRDAEGNIIERQPGYNIYKQNKKDQWKYDGFILKHNKPEEKKEEEKEMDSFNKTLLEFHNQYKPFETENKIEESNTKNGVTTYHGWYNNKPFVASKDNSTDYMELLDGDYDQEEEILDWLVSHNFV